MIKLSYIRGQIRRMFDRLFVSIIHSLHFCTPHLLPSKPRASLRFRVEQYSISLLLPWPPLLLLPPKDHICERAKRRLLALIFPFHVCNAQ